VNRDSTSDLHVLVERETKCFTRHDNSESAAVSIAITKGGESTMRHTFSVISVRISAAALAALIALGPPAFAAPLIGRQQDQGSTLEVPNLGHQPSSDDTPPIAIPNPGPMIQIPQRFLGCWTGAVSESDLTRLHMITSPIIGAWLTKQYRVCFEREPGGLKATLVDSDVQRHQAVVEAKSEMTPISANEDAIILSGNLRMVERNAVQGVGAPLKVTSIVDENVRLEGLLDPSGVMRVRGFVKGYYNGREWFLASWASDFQHQQSP